MVEQDSGYQQVPELQGAVMSIPALRINVTNKRLAEMLKDVNEISAKLDELSKTNAAIAQLVDQMWYAPGMPGAVEAQKHFGAAISGK